MLREEHEKECEKYENNPESHPDFNKEKEEFVEMFIKLKMINGEDPFKYNISEEWKSHWKVKLSMLLENSWSKKKEMCLSLLDKTKDESRSRSRDRSKSKCSRNESRSRSRSLSRSRIRKRSISRTRYRSRSKDKSRFRIRSRSRNRSRSRSRSRSRNFSRSRNRSRSRSKLMRDENSSSSNYNEEKNDDKRLNFYSYKSEYLDHTENRHRYLSDESVKSNSESSEIQLGIQDLEEIEENVHMLMNKNSSGINENNNYNHKKSIKLIQFIEFLDELLSLPKIIEFLSEPLKVLKEKCTLIHAHNRNMHRMFDEENKMLLRMLSEKLTIYLTKSNISDRILVKDMLDKLKVFIKDFSDEVNANLSKNIDNDATSSYSGKNISKRYDIEKPSEHFSVNQLTFEPEEKLDLADNNSIFSQNIDFKKYFISNSSPTCSKYDLNDHLNYSLNNEEQIEYDNKSYTEKGSNKWKNEQHEINDSQMRSYLKDKQNNKLNLGYSVQNECSSKEENTLSFLEQDDLRNEINKMKYSHPLITQQNIKSPKFYGMDPESIVEKCNNYKYLNDNEKTEVLNILQLIEKSDRSLASELHMLLNT